MVGAMLAAPGLAGLPYAVRAAGGAALMAFLTCAGAYALNDLFDVASDRIVKPSRPLADGKVGARGALVVSLALWGCAGIVAVRSGRLAAGFWLGWIVLLAAYSWRVKSWGLAGNVLVSAVASSAFLLGAACVGKVEAGVVPAAISVIVHLGREIAKSAADVRGDRAAEVMTIAVRIGSRAALRLSLWCVAAAFATSILPFVFSEYGTAYLIAVVAGAYPLLGLSLRRIVLAGRAPADDDRSREAAARSVAKLLKLVMPVGLLAFLLEAL